MKPLIGTSFVAVVLVGVLSAFAVKTRSPAKPRFAIATPTETAVFAGGCFWGVQSAFAELPGVMSSRVGYTGGTAPNPIYSKVVTGLTGHAEAVEVTFDPDRISYSKLVRFHLEHVRPSNREPDASYETKHYRHSIFVRGDAQRTAAESALAEYNQSAPEGKARNVLIEDTSVFWEAEAEHQNYLSNCTY